MISARDKEILRNLAKHQMELSQAPENLQKAEEWMRHNRAIPGRPMIHLELWTFSQEVIPPRLRCESEEARGIESALYSNFLNQELFGDDRVTPDYFPVYVCPEFTLFDLPICVQETEGLGHQFVPIITDLEADYNKLKPSTYSYDRAAEERRFQEIGDLLGDILPPKRIMGGITSVPTQMVVHFMGMENMMYNMMDYPDLFKEMMDRIADDTLAYFRFLEKEKILLPTTRNEGVCQATFAYTDELKKEGDLLVKDVWGFMDSQESSSISPDMYEEFLFPCYQKIASEFGLLSYGCCEPVNPVWDRCISKFQNLRKVSISPWCDEDFMGERLKGGKVIYHRKPSPNFLGVDEVLDEDAVRNHIDHTLEAAKGCTLEITQRDVYTIHHNEQKAVRYVELIKEEIEKKWHA